VTSAVDEKGYDEEQRNKEGQDAAEGEVIETAEEESPCKGEDRYGKQAS